MLELNYCGNLLYRHYMIKVKNENFSAIYISITISYVCLASFCKLYYKTKMHFPVKLKFSTLVGIINLSTNFGDNPTQLTNYSLN